MCPPLWDHVLTAGRLREMEEWRKKVTASTEQEDAVRMAKGVVDKVEQLKKRVLELLSVMKVKEEEWPTPAYAVVRKGAAAEDSEDSGSRDISVDLEDKIVHFENESQRLSEDAEWSDQDVTAELEALSEKLESFGDYIAKLEERARKDQSASGRSLEPAFTATSVSDGDEEFCGGSDCQERSYRSRVAPLGREKHQKSNSSFGSLLGERFPFASGSFREESRSPLEVERRRSKSSHSDSSSSPSIPLAVHTPPV